MPSTPSSWRRFSPPLPSPLLVALLGLTGVSCVDESAKTSEPSTKTAARDDADAPQPPAKAPAADGEKSAKPRDATAANAADERDTARGAAKDSGGKDAAKGADAERKPPDAAAEQTAAAQTETDPYKVPADASPEELLEYLNGLVQSQPETEEDRDRMLQAIVSASEGILKAKDAEKSTQIEAIEWKIRALSVMSRLEMKGANEKLDAFVAELKNDERPEIVELVAQIEMQRRLQKLAEAEGEELKTLAGAMVDELKQGQPSQDQFQLGQQIARVLEYKDQSELAGKAYQALAELARKSDNKRINDMAEKFEGSARRAQLPGHEIEIQGTTLAGESFDIKQLHGKVVLVDFWATWCGPCIAEIPNVKRNYEQYHDKGFEVVGISLDEDVEALEEFIKENEIPWSTLFERGDQAKQGWDNPIAVRYGISGIPTVILVNQQGKVVSLNARGPELGRHLSELLGPTPGADEDTAPSAPDESE